MRRKRRLPIRGRVNNGKKKYNLKVYNLLIVGQLFKCCLK